MLAIAAPETSTWDPIASSDPPHSKLTRSRSDPTGANTTPATTASLPWPEMKPSSPLSACERISPAAAVSLRHDSPAARWQPLRTSVSDSVLDPVYSPAPLAELHVILALWTVSSVVAPTAVVNL